MKLNNVIYNTKEISESKLLDIIKNNFKLTSRSLRVKLKELYSEKDIANIILDEYDLIQQKKSLLTKSQRDQILGFIGLCMIKMVKGNEKEDK